MIICDWCGVVHKERLAFCSEAHKKQYYRHGKTSELDVFVPKEDGNVPIEDIKQNKDVPIEDNNVPKGDRLQSLDVPNEDKSVPKEDKEADIVVIPYDDELEPETA